MTTMSGRIALEHGDDLGRGRHVPDVDAQPDDLGIPGEERFGDIYRALVDVEFQEGGAARSGPRLARRYRRPKAAWMYLALRVVRTMSGILLQSKVQSPKSKVQSPKSPSLQSSPPLPAKLLAQAGVRRGWQGWPARPQGVR